MPVSSSLSLSRLPTSVVALIAAVALVAAACSSAPDVEAGDTSSTEAPPDTEAVDDSGSDAASDDQAIEAETDAMGEDDDDPTAEVESTDDESGTAPDETAGQTESGGSIDSPELAAALAAGEGDAFTLPFMYITADQDCDGCAGTVSLYYVPGDDTPSILVLAAAYVDGTEIDLSQVDPSLRAGDPRRIAEQLADAGATEGDYSIDPVSGLITRWTLDGDTVTLRCLQVDTRPVDMRAELCRDSLIG